jgi:hypothetical protein
MYNWSFTPVEARADNDRSRVYLSHIPSMFTPGLAIFFLATILRPNHVRGVQWSRVWRKRRFLEHSIIQPCRELAENHAPIQICWEIEELEPLLRAVGTKDAGLS